MNRPRFVQVTDKVAVNPETVTHMEAGVYQGSHPRHPNRAWVKIHINGSTLPSETPFTTGRSVMVWDVTLDEVLEKLNSPEDALREKWMALRDAYGGSMTGRMPRPGDQVGINAEDFARFANPRVWGGTCGPIPSPPDEQSEFTHLNDGEDEEKNDGS